MRAIITAGMLAVAAVMLAGCGGGGDGAPGAAGKPGGASVSESKEGENWTHKEMVDHLKAKGLKFETEGTATAAGPGMFIILGDVRVYSQLCKTSRDAKEQAAVNMKDSFAWGRYRFTGPEPLLGKIKAALK